MRMTSISSSGCRAPAAECRRRDAGRCRARGSSPARSNVVGRVLEELAETLVGVAEQALEVAARRQLERRHDAVAEVGREDVRARAAVGADGRTASRLVARARRSPATRWIQLKWRMRVAWVAAAHIANCFDECQSSRPGYDVPSALSIAVACSSSSAHANVTSTRGGTRPWWISYPASRPVRSQRYVAPPTCSRR